MTAEMTMLERNVLGGEVRGALIILCTQLQTGGKITVAEKVIEIT